MSNNAGGSFRTDSLDDPARKIAQNIRAGLGQQPLQKFRLKLAAIAGVGAPFAGDHQPLANGGKGNSTHHGDHGSAADTKAQNGIAVVVILINHSTDRALNNL